MVQPAIYGAFDKSGWKKPFSVIYLAQLDYFEVKNNQQNPPKAINMTSGGSSKLPKTLTLSL